MAERTNAAGSRPVLPSGKLGFKSLPRRSTISLNPNTFVPHTFGIYTYKNTGESMTEIEWEWVTKEDIKRTVERHNNRSDNIGLLKITKRIHSHLFRYHAQTRDELEDFRSILPMAQSISQVVPGLQVTA